MPRGEKTKYTDKQKRQAEHIEEGYKEKGVAENEAGKSGSGRHKSDEQSVYQRAGSKGGKR